MQARRRVNIIKHLCLLVECRGDLELSIVKDHNRRRHDTDVHPELICECGKDMQMQINRSGAFNYRIANVCLSCSLDLGQRMEFYMAANNECLWLAYIIIRGINMSVAQEKFEILLDAYATKQYQINHTII